MTNDHRSYAVQCMLERIDSTLADLTPGFPHHANPQTGLWTRTPAGDWTGGFWVGMLWLAALHTGRADYREHARVWTQKLRPRVESKSVFKGFLFYYGVELGNLLLCDTQARELALEGTQGLVCMYNQVAKLIPLGIEAEEASNVGANEANIDSLPGTIRLLMGRGQASASYEIGRQHLLQHIALCVREDGSICQSATFDPQTGKLVRRYTHKGIHENSTWARAQAWGMLGLAQALQSEAGEFRDVAMRVADWWLDHVPPDHVAYWDFDDPAIPNTERDTSATAIAAAALLKLARFIPPREERYRKAAEATVDQLVRTHLTPIGSNDARLAGILANGCFNKKLGVATANELIWGDYFLFESLLALDGFVSPERI